ncbi:MAG: two-component system, LytTR family, response regulator [Acidobacteriota bacterium]|jgi:two-component system LytT family response regulator|nr:two-component system, LytTR family, response regulator [Acidobacteriota bacterium]
MKIRTLIVDDERHARQKIRSLLAGKNDVEIVRECANGDDAVRAIRETRPDLIFLDVQMPGRSGFDVLRDAADDVKHIVFVTAHDQYALQAFEVQALDYLLKPFDRDRFEKTLDRVRGRMQNDSGDLQAKLRALVEQMHESDALQRLMIKSAGRITFLRVDEIDWLEAADNYVRIHAGRETHLIRETMNHLETRLDKRKFVRIHRGAIVNIDAVAEVRALFHGDHSVLLRTGVSLPLGRAYRDRLLSSRA